MLTAELPTHIKVLPMSNTRRQNRETFIRLFQGFVDEYGEDAGERIIRHLVIQAGGLRMWVPSPGPDPLARCGFWFRRLWRNTCREFGRKSGRAIMNKIITELGSRRVNFPDNRDLYLWERNTKIKKQFNGDNAAELGLRWGLSSEMIIIIVRDESYDPDGSCF